MNGSGRAEIARSHGWMYSEDSDGRLGRGSEESAGLSAFGIHSVW